MGRLWLNVGTLALDARSADSGDVTTCALGIELVAMMRPRLGWNAEPPARPRLALALLALAFLVGDRTPLMVLTTCSRGETICERTSPPPIGISPDVGVGEAEGRAVGESLPRRSSWVAGES